MSFNQDCFPVKSELPFIENFYREQRAINKIPSLETCGDGVGQQAPLACSAEMGPSRRLKIILP